MVKCLGCGNEVPSKSAFCPICGVAVEVKKSDDEIAKLIFPLFGKKYDEAMASAYTACLYDQENSILHKNLLPEVSSS